MIKKDFLDKYQITNEDFISTGLKWEELLNIYNHYISIRDQYETAAKSIVETLQKVKSVHSVKYRIKDGEHLIEKIIRKKKTDPLREYNIDNYREKIDDIIGVRAIHLYKSDWQIIGDHITNTWDLKGSPIANIRNGDSDEITNIFKARGYEINIHEQGYRSIHFIIETQPGKQKFTSEIQVRTIFEEGWSEIDHDIRYPYNLKNPIFNSYLSLFNRLAGSADEMGTYIKTLQSHLSEINDKHKEALKKQESIIADLKNKIEYLKIDTSTKNDLSYSINQLSLQSNLSAFAFNQEQNYSIGPNEAWNSISSFIIPASNKEDLCCSCGKYCNHFSLNDSKICSKCNRRYCINCWNFQKMTSSNSAFDLLNLRLQDDICNICKIE